MKECCASTRSQMFTRMSSNLQLASESLFLPERARVCICCDLLPIWRFLSKSAFRCIPHTVDMEGGTLVEVQGIQFPLEPNATVGNVCVSLFSRQMARGCFFLIFAFFL